MKARAPCTWRELCEELPYSTIMRWRSRCQQGLPLCQKPGPKKPASPDWLALIPLLQGLQHGRVRTRGTTKVYRRFSHCISRRQLARWAKVVRQTQRDSMKHVQWLWSGLAWSMDATEYGPEGCQLIPVQDLASRYRLAPLVTDRLNGCQIARHLENLFRQHGAPLLLKRDNGSPFNHHAIDELMARYCVLPLNNPPHYPRYNGSMEKGIGDLKRSLDQRWGQPTAVPPHWPVLVETTVHELNHRSRRCLKGRTACAVFHDPAQRLRWNRHKRLKIFRLLYQNFLQTIGNMVNRNHHTTAAAWRLTVECWLRRQGLISIRHQPNKKVSTTFSKFWSHN